MKIITKAVLDWDGNILEEESFDYDGPIASADPSGGIISAGIGAAGSILGGNNDSTQEIKNDPWGPAQPALKNILGYGQNAYDAGYQNTPFQTFAPMNDLQQQGIQQNLNYSQGLMPNQIGQAQGAWNSALNAPDVANNPYVLNQLGIQAKLANRNLAENIIPGIQGDATATGQSGSSRQGVAEGIASRGTQEAILNQAGQTMLGAYGQGLGARGNALGQSGNMMGLGMLPGATMQQAGGQLNQEAQRYIDEAMQRQNFGQQNPWDQISRFQNVAQPISGQGGTQTQPNPYQSNPFASALGGGLAGYGLYDAFQNSGAGSSPYGGPTIWPNANPINTPWGGR